MGFNQRSAVPLSPITDPLLPIADSSQGHDIVTGVAPSLAKEQDWIMWLANRQTYYDASGSGAGILELYSAPANTGSFLYVSSSVVVLDVSGCVAGDVLRMSLHTNIQMVLDQNNVREMRLVVVEDYGGAGTVRTTVGKVSVVGNDNALFGGVSISTKHTIITPGTARVMAQAGVFDNTGEGIEVRYSWNLAAVRVRS